MSYYTKLSDAECQQRGIDQDLLSAMYHHGMGIKPEGIKRVLAVVEGENDGPEWHWLIELKDSQYAYATGGCDYTGWD